MKPTQRLWRFDLDLAMWVIALAIAAPSLLYPFGRDQALYHYVGREWLNGLVPHRDAFDQKPPLIYALHALGVAWFGTGQWVIRFFDILAVIGIG